MPWVEDVGAPRPARAGPGRDPGRAPGCIAVLPPGPGVCRICCAASGDGARVCWNCRRTCDQLGAPLVPITPVSLATRDSAVYHLLRRYKSADPVAGLQRQHLAALLSVFFGRHLACIAPGGIDAVAVVPSSTDSRPPPHPLSTVLSSIDGLPPVLHCLVPGSDPAGHRRAGRLAVSVTSSLRGARVLVVDDVCTTGAHLQSAVWAVRAGGAAAVHPVVVGRFLRRDWPASRTLLRLACDHRWDAGCCIRCAAAPGGVAAGDSGVTTTRKGPPPTLPTCTTIGTRQPSPLLRSERRKGEEDLWEFRTGSAVR
ncbi:MAG: hypothetical protein ACYDHU_03465 [Acidimicrobiales bacterium]